MAEYTTVARPYAEAIFKLAQQEDALSDWSEALARLKSIFINAGVSDYFARPASVDLELTSIIAKDCTKKTEIASALANFLNLLSVEKKTVLIPLLVDAFEVLKTEADGVKLLSIVSAFPLSEKQLSDLTKQLTIHYKYNFKVKTVTVDQSLIGGVTVQFGDQVIDLSVRYKLAQMAKTITH